MIKDALSQFPYIWLTCAGLFIFLFVFCGMLVWVFRKSSQKIYQHLETLPLQEEGYR